jgi:serine/threonine protein phosphatase PrpC
MPAGDNRVFQMAQVCEKGGLPNNEDYCGSLQVSHATLWLVADGLGGHNGGELASKTAVETALESFRRNPEVSADSLESHFRAAHEAILRAQKQDPAVVSMRTTMVALLSDSRNVIWGHVGDSRLYRFQPRGIVLQTEDHSVPQALVKAGEITSRQIRGHPDRSRLLRTLGEQGQPRVSVPASVTSLEKTDAFLLCTDGFWENVLELEMLADWVASATPETWLVRATSRLRARVHGDFDNYCAVAIFCNPGSRLGAADKNTAGSQPVSPAADSVANSTNSSGLGQPVMDVYPGSSMVTNNANARIGSIAVALGEPIWKEA